MKMKYNICTTSSSHVLTCYRFVSEGQKGTNKNTNGKGKKREMHGINVKNDTVGPKGLWRVK